MGISIFRRSFVIRRFDEECSIGGHSAALYHDTVTELDVQPLSADELKALPEGERRTKRMKAFGDTVLRTSEEETGQRGDWLFYQGKMDQKGHWYECVSSVGWDHTLLGHCKSEFVMVSEAESSNMGRPTIRADGKGGCYCE